MAKRTRRREQSLSPGQASYIIDRLLRDRKITRADLSRYMDEMRREISDLEDRLRSLRTAAMSTMAGVVDRVRGGNAAARSGKKRAGRALTPERKASQQLQGRYLGLIRQIPVSKRAYFQRLAKEKGREVAIKEMITALGR